MTECQTKGSTKYPIKCVPKCPIKHLKSPIKYMAIFFFLLLSCSSYTIFANETMPEKIIGKTTNEARGETIENSIAQIIENSGDYVVLLHGISRSSKQMNKLEKYLQKQGYEVINLDYPSTDYTLESLTDLVHADISKKIKEDKAVHFVGFSMGSLIVRLIAHKHRPKNFGRMVQIAPPNNGSEVSDFFKDNFLYKKFLGEAGQQLITDQRGIEHLFGEIDYDLGIIAGNNTVAPLSSIILIPGDDDGRVSVKSTQLDGMKDHIIVSSSHTFLPSNKIVHQQVGYFLKNGVFNKDLGD